MLKKYIMQFKINTLTTSSYFGIKKILFMSVCDRVTNQTLRSILTKFCTQNLGRKILIEFVQ